MLAIDPLHRPTTAQQVLVELQKIARSSSNNKSKRTNISKNNSEAISKKAKSNKKAPAKEKSDSSPYLVVALTFCIILIIGLLVKDFI